MARKQLGGLAIIADVSGELDESSSEAQVGMFYAVPNPVVHGQRLTLLWETTNIPKVRVIGTGGYDSGILDTVAQQGYLTLSSGVQVTTTYTLLGLDSNGVALMSQGAPVSANLKVNMA